MASFTLGGVTVAPGTRAVVELPAAQLYTQTPLNIPVHIVNGRRPGPVLLVTAAIHGDELNGIDVVRRLLGAPFLKQLRGTVVAVPVVNVFGFIYKSRYLPDRRDLNRCFPGSEQGSLGSRMAHLIRTEVLDKVDYAIDLHTGAIHRSNLPQVRVNIANENSKALAEAFGVPVVINSVLSSGTLRDTAESQGIPMITYEAGEALRFDEACIRAGLRGVRNVMRHLKMLPPGRGKYPVPEPHIALNSSWVRANTDGVFRPIVALGAYIRRGDVLGVINSPFTMEATEIKSPFAGILVGRENLPLVNEGEALFHIARFDEVDDVAEQVESWSTEIHEPREHIEAPIAPSEY